MGSIAILAGLQACKREANERPAETAAEARSVDEGASAANPPTLYQRSRPMMGTIYQISVDAPEEKAAPAVRAAFDEIARLEDVLSEWRPHTTISKVNASAGQAPVEVDEDTFHVVEVGLEVSRLSGGAFDMSWAALRGLYDFRERTTPDLDELQRRLPLVDYRNVSVDDESRTVHLRQEGMSLGTGGIGKGYALDRAGAILESHGLTSFMLNAGGQVQVRGMRGDRPWRVGIQHPRSEAPFAFIESTSGSVSTSGDYERFFIDVSGRRIHHIIDPSTGLPASGSRSVTVATANGTHADALSTAVFVLGPERGLELLAQLPFQAEAVVIDADCRVLATPGTREKLVLLVELDGDRLPSCE